VDNELSLKNVTAEGKLHLENAKNLLVTYGCVLSLYICEHFLDPFTAVIQMSQYDTIHEMSQLPGLIRAIHRKIRLFAEEDDDRALMLKIKGIVNDTSSSEYDNLYLKLGKQTRFASSFVVVQ
jgi:hypothetical protein